MNKQITEDYCSFETAKLLKEKGFDIKCNTYFISDNEIAVIPILRDFNNNGIYLSAPTQSLALKWLREVKKIHISLYAVLDPPEEGCIPEKITYTYNILDASKPFCFFDEYDECDMYPPQFNSYEEAVEAAIKYTLENLI